MRGGKRGRGSSKRQIVETLISLLVMLFDFAFHSSGGRYQKIRFFDGHGGNSLSDCLQINVRTAIGITTVAIFTAIAGIKRNRFLAVGLLVVVALGCLAAGNILRKRGTSTIVSPQCLFVSEDDMDLGEMFFTDTTVDHSFTIHNPTDQAITITNWKATCDCIDISPRTLTVPARSGQTLIAKLRIDDPEKTGKPPKSSAVVLVEPVTDRERSASERFRFRYSITPSVTLASKRYVGSAIVGPSPKEFNPVKLSINPRFRFKHVDCLDPHFRVFCESTTDGISARLLYSGGKPVGHYSLLVSVTLEDTLRVPSTVARNVILHYRIDETFSILPGAVDCQEFESGRIAQYSFSILNHQSPDTVKIEFFPLVNAELVQISECEYCLVVLDVPPLVQFTVGWLIASNGQSACVIPIDLVIPPGTFEKRSP